MVLTTVVYMVLCACWICGVVYIWCYVHVVYAELCTYGVVCLLVHVVLCTCCTCDVVCRWCCVHVIHVALCTCVVVYMLFMW